MNSDKDKHMVIDGAKQHQMIDCGSYAVWFYRRPLSRRSAEWVTKWGWAPRSNCGTYWMMSAGGSEFPDRASAESAAAEGTGQQ